MTAPKTIQLDGCFRHEEYLTAAAIKPGHLVEIYDASGTVKTRVHSTAKGWAEKMFAVEDPLAGQTATSTQSRTIDTDYASGDLVPVHIVERGARVYAWLKPGTNYVVGDKLMSAGDGTLDKISGTADLDVVAILTENKDLSASGAAAARAVVRVH
jgi:predicted methyltransferase